MAEECTQHQCCQFPVAESYQYKAYVAHFAHFWCSSCSRMLSTEGCTNYLWNIGFWRGRKQPRFVVAGRCFGSLTRHRGQGAHYSTCSHAA